MVYAWNISIHACVRKWLVKAGRRCDYMLRLLLPLLQDCGAVITSWQCPNYVPSSAERVGACHGIIQG